PPIGREHCDWLYGIFGHETSCTRYWTCWNGTSTEQLCIGGLLYNENTHSCDWPENVDGCQKHPLCNDDANGNVPLGKSCNRYWQCQGGYPRLQRCPAMLVFDKRTLRCVVPPTEDCEVPTTIAPPPEEEDEGPNVPQGAPPQRGQQQQGGQPQRAPQGFQQRQQDYQQSNQRAQEANQRTQDYQQSNQRNQDYQNNQRQQDYQQKNLLGVDEYLKCMLNRTIISAKKNSLPELVFEIARVFPPDEHSYEQGTKLVRPRPNNGRNEKPVLASSVARTPMDRFLSGAMMTTRLENSPGIAIYVSP
ncbi:unnamed protein product, partial [Nesidiocoris tenuis]